MSLSTTITYDVAGNFTFDSDKVEFTTGNATLKLQTNSQDFTEDFANDTGFTYDSDLVEFTGGVVQQKAIVVADELMAATIVTGSADADRFTTSGTATLVGTASITDISGTDYIDCSDNAAEQYVQYNSDNAEFGQKGCIRFKFIPDYDNAPASNRYFFLIDNSSQANQIWMYHQSSGNIQLRLRNNSAAVVLTKDYPGVSFNQGQEYEIELNFDVTIGEIRLFIDGVQEGTTDTTTLTRTTVTIFRIGSAGGASTEMFFRDIQTFPEVQHTTDFTSEIPRLVNLYAESNVTLPEFDHGTLGTLQAATGLVTTEAGSPRYTIQLDQSSAYLYWNGSAWVTSDNTYAQANDASTFNTNVSALAVSGDRYQQIQLHFTDSATSNNVDNLVLTNNAETAYSTDNPTVLLNTTVNLDAMDSFTESSTLSGSDLVKYTCFFVGQEYYHNGSAWAVSDGTYAQTNTAAEINTNVSTIPIGAGGGFRMKAFLHSDDGTTTPSLISNTFEYCFFTPADEPTTALVYGFLYDNNAPLSGITVEFESSQAFTDTMNNLVYVAATETTASNGYFSIDLPKTSHVAGATIKMTAKFTNVAGNTVERVYSLDVTAATLQEQFEDLIV